MKKSSLFIVIFLVSVILIGPFIIKNIMNNSILEDNIEVASQITEQPKEKIDEKNDIIQNEIRKNQEQMKNEEKKINEKKIVEKEYFDDALFIGDSRTVGISEYGELNNATFFANTGMSVYNVFDKKVAVPKVGKVKLDQLLTSKKYGKVYIMLGINELGYNSNNTLKKYKELVKFVQNKQNNAIIYIEANLHVTVEKSNKDKVINNVNINKFNNEISKLADNEKIFYIDINEKFDDKDGNLSSNYTQDNVHIYAKYYKEWSDWLSQNAVK